MTLPIDETETAYRDNRVILVVEDEPLLLDILATELDDCGYHVLRALTGESAVAALRDRTRRIDLLVTDIRLPGQVDGWAVAEEARRLQSDIPVIYVTGFFSQASREVGNGITIMKPYRPSAIIAAARKLWATQAKSFRQVNSGMGPRDTEIS